MIKPLRRWFMLFSLVGGLAPSCGGAAPPKAEPADSGPQACADGQHRFEARCVVPCPTYNGSLCELDGTPIFLPASGAKPSPKSDAAPACEGAACDQELVDVVLGRAHTCVLQRSGSVFCFGDNAMGQLAGSNATTPIADLDALEISAGDDHTCARLRDRSVRCWGRNDKGQLGGGDILPQSHVVSVAGLSGVEQLGLAHSVSFARLTGGSVVFWGVAWGDARAWSTSPSTAYLADTVAVAAGRVGVCGRVSDDSVRCAGNHDGAAGGSAPDRPLVMDGATVRGVSRIACSGGAACLALNADQRIVGWGFHRDGIPGQGMFMDIRATPALIGGLSHVVDIAVGHEHACALIRDGNVFCWGRDRSGQLERKKDQPVPTLLKTLPGATRLFSSPAARGTCALMATGKLVCWGDNSLGQLSVGPFVHM